MCEKEGAVNSRNPPCFRQSSLEHPPRILAVDHALDTGDAEQGGDANGRFGSLGLLQGQRQKVIRHECSLPDCERGCGDSRAGNVCQINEAPGGGQWIATLEPIIPVRLIDRSRCEQSLQDAPGWFVVCFEENLRQAPWNSGDASLTAAHAESGCAESASAIKLALCMIGRVPGGMVTCRSSSGTVETL
jgi:hypothetical protein